MAESLEPILRELGLLDTLITLEDPELGAFLQATGVLPFYSLSWVLTWFSHDLDDFDLILRLFDLFLSSTPMMPLYLSAALVLADRTALLQQDPDPSILHSHMCRLPLKNQNDMDGVIARALAMEARWDPRAIQSHANVALDHTSVINTLTTHEEDIVAILALKPEERSPLDLNLTPSSSPSSSWHMLMMMGAVGIGAAAILLARPDLLSQSWSPL